MTETSLRRCACGENCQHPQGCWQPATTEYFHRDNHRQDGLNTKCKVCKGIAAKQYRLNNYERILKQERDQKSKNRERLNELARNRYSQNPEPRRADQRRYHENHPGRRKEIDKRSREKHIDERRAKDKEYSRTHRTIKNAKNRDWRKRNPYKIKASKQRRIARENGLPVNFTDTDWIRCLNYFKNCCAVCGRPLYGLFHTAATDHWIPLSDSRPDNPGTVRMNILPLCHSLKDGEKGCNNRKLNRDPVEFVTTEFGKRRAKQILARIEAYFEWVRSNPSR